MRAPRRAAVESQAVRTDASTHDASLYTFGVQVPLQTRLLLRAELSYVSLTTPNDIRTGFGDARLRVRTHVAAGNQRALFLVGAFRAGSGSASLFPYSTASVDIEGGLAAVDTLSSSTALWLYAAGTRPTRVRENLKQAGLYPDYLTLAGGVVLSPLERLDVEGGVVAYVFRDDAPRELYFVAVDLRYSDATAFYASFQAEAGDEQRRAVDFAAVVGIQIHYR